MKKLLTILFAVAFIGTMTMSCQEDCKNCKTKETNNTTGVVTEGSSSEYCDEQLEQVENEEPATVGDITSTWVCE